MGYLACAMAPLLSQYKSTGSDILGIIPNPVMNFLIQTASLAASEVAMYSASIVESATLFYFELLQLTVPPFKQKTYPDCDRKSSFLDWKLASV